MRARILLTVAFFFAIVGLIGSSSGSGSGIGPLVAAQGQETPGGAQSDGQRVAVTDSRTGDAPCGFAVQRDLAGSVHITPTIDDAGNLVLAIDEINLQGTLTNPANGASVTIMWVHQNGALSVVADGHGTDLLLGLEGMLFRGYDTARAELAMSLPGDGGSLVSFSPDDHADDPWAHVCGLLA
jgi:hypothetical protein